MSIEQWVVLALVIALSLLEAVARLRRARATRSLNVGGSDTAAPSEPRRSPLSKRYTSESVMRAAEKLVAPTASQPPPASAPGDVSLARLSRSQESLSRGSGSLEPQRRAPKSRPGDGVVQWLRPVRSLRRAIVVATILAPPSR